VKRRDTILLVVGLAVLLAAAVFLRLLSGMLTDYWWYRGLGHGPVYTRILLARVILYLVGFAACFLAVASGIWLAERRAGPTPVVFYRMGQWTLRGPSVRRNVRLALWAGAVLAGLIGGGVAAPLWRRVLLFLHRVPFGSTDPIFGNDVGFYVFTYPLLGYLRQWLQVLVWLSLAASVVLYASRGLFAERGSSWFGPRAMGHINKMIGLIFVLMAAGYFLNRYELLYSVAGVSYGAGYTDIHARLPALWIMMAATLGIAGIFFAARAQVRPRLLLTAVAVWFGCVVVFQGAYPALLQWFRVEPNELELESPYIANTIAGTLEAYGLHQVQELPYDVREDLTYDALTADRETIDNVRLWDWRPLLDTFRQTQGLRTYYNFGGIDVDRYELQRGTTATMLAVREVYPKGLDASAQTWVNLRLKFTHGYGLCLASVNEHTAEGQPQLIIKNIPPETPEELPLTQPRIYYGRQTTDYVLVNTRAEEIDYPSGDDNVTNRYDGRGGVLIDSAFRKLLFYLRFRDVKILLSDDLVSGSRVLYHRTIAARVRRLAPYLMLESEPYAVLNEGRIVWIQDCYTNTSFYPYSEPTGGLGLNYIRNSVKAVVDAYDGSVTLYVADPGDPLIQAYARIFPGLYKSMDEMPAGLRRHVRYPKGLFSVQADKYRAYHMMDPQVFYNKEDLWEVPLEQYRGEERPVESYYIIMRLPQGERAEFVLMQPFTPRNRDNMIAWLAARCDAEHYGELIVFKFPKGKLVYGPRQVEARIDQNPDISQQLTLWSQRGSQVIRGNLLVIPVAGGILYTEPLFIQAETGAVPELRRVITSYGDSVAMRPTLTESLRALFGLAGEAPVAEAAPAPAAQPEVPPEVADLVRAALDHYAAAQDALKAGDWAQYGRQMDLVRDALERLKGDVAPAESPQ